MSKLPVTSSATAPTHVVPKLSLQFRPDPWNDPKTVSKANCLAYALDRQDLGWAFLDHVLPVAALEKEIKPTISARLQTSQTPHIKLLFSGLTRIREHAHAPDTHHVIAYSPAMSHFFRLDGDCTWSHKQGGTEATNKDAQGHVITDPGKADFNFRAFDSRAFYLRSLQSIDEIKQDRLYQPRVKRELVQQQRMLIKKFSPTNPHDNQIAYFALPKSGIAVIPKTLA